MTSPKLTLPQHVAFIMDGNGRWALERGLTRIDGHQEGKKRIEPIIQKAVDLGIQFLTFYAFSSENWLRPEEEISSLMSLLYNSMRSEAKKMHEKGVRLKVIGDRALLAPKIQREITRLEKLTENNARITVIIALSYGSRQEIIEAIRKVWEATQQGGISPENLTPEHFSQFLYTAGVPDPDLIIRTSGEHRLSNFLLWQGAYAELQFPDTYWPDFTADKFAKAIEQYTSCERRYGKISAQL